MEDLLEAPPAPAGPSSGRPENAESDASTTASLDRTFGAKRRTRVALSAHFEFHGTVHDRRTALALVLVTASPSGGGGTPTLPEANMKLAMHSRWLGKRKLSHPKKYSNKGRSGSRPACRKLRGQHR